MTERDEFAQATGRPNKGMKLTKLVAAPERAYKVPACARAVRLDAGTASHLIPGVGRTRWSAGGQTDDGGRSW